MPTYDYECTKGHTFDIVQRITEDPIKKCPVCKSKARRVISAASFILKGSGWYADGYSKPKPSSGSSGEGSKSSSSESSKSGSGDRSKSSSGDSSKSSSSSGSGGSSGSGSSSD
jgi:putative FmdB family regulatory protein